MPLTVWTIGHSTRSLDEMVAVLQAYRIAALADIRRYPGSRHLPQFSVESLRVGLGAAGIEYVALPELGGRRRPDPESPNDGWRHEAFRGYADFTATEEFADGLARLLDVASAMPTAIMCAEVLWWRCHRRLVADVLVSLGVEVVHIRDATHAEPHRLSAPARLVDGVLTWSAE